MKATQTSIKRLQLRVHIFIIGCLIGLALGCQKVNVDCNLGAYPHAPDLSWFVSHAGTGDESHGHHILACSDGGFLQVGETGIIPGSAKVLVVKTDGEGTLVWKQEFGEGGHNLGNSSLEMDDGYLICGALDENSALIKLNKADGSVIFQKSYDNGGSDAFEHLAATQNQIVAVGYINAEDNSNTFFTEGEGQVTFLNLQGERTGGFSINDHLAHAYRVVSHDNELIVSGLTEGANDYGLVKMDSLGNILWAKKYGGSGADHCFGMDVSDEGDIFLTGHTLSGTENWDTYTLKIDQNGNEIWDAVRGNPRGFDPKFIHDEAWGIKGTEDGGCIVVAGTGDEYGRYKRRCGNEGDNSNTWHVYLLKLSASGELDWQRTYGNGGDWAGEDIALTPDGGAVIAVDNGEFGFLKIEPL